MSKSKKIIHVLGSMDVGGVETWLMSILRNTDSEKIQNEFIVHLDNKAYFDEDITRLGSKKHICNNDNVFKYMYKLFFLLRKIKPDVIHSHVHAFSGIVMFISWLAGVKSRVSHSHSDPRMKGENRFLRRKIYYFCMRILIMKFSTYKIAVSDLAAESLYGKDWSKIKKLIVMPCGLDLKKYKNDISYPNLYKEFNIPKDAFIIGHVGRFSEPKNHEFLIDVFNDIFQINDKAYLLLVGDGSLRGLIKEKVSNLEIESRVVFAGLRDDVPLIMHNVFDVFAFPSLWEGMPLVVIEAQVSGLKTFVSNRVTREVDCGNAVFLPLDKEKWVQALILNKDTKELNKDTKELNKDTKELNKDTKELNKDLIKFTVEDNIRKLIKIYGD